MCVCVCHNKGERLKEDKKRPACSAKDRGMCSVDSNQESHTTCKLKTSKLAAQEAKIRMFLTLIVALKLLNCDCCDYDCDTPQKHDTLWRAAWIVSSLVGYSHTDKISLREAPVGGYRARKRDT